MQTLAFCSTLYIVGIGWTHEVGGRDRQRERQRIKPCPRATSTWLSAYLWWPVKRTRLYLWMPLNNGVTEKMRSIHLSSRQWLAKQMHEVHSETRKWILPRLKFRCQLIDCELSLQGTQLNRMKSQHEHWANMWLQMLQLEHELMSTNLCVFCMTSA